MSLNAPIIQLSDHTGSDFGGLSAVSGVISGEMEVDNQKAACYIKVLLVSLTVPVRFLTRILVLCLVPLQNRCTGGC